MLPSLRGASFATVAPRKLGTTYMVAQLIELKQMDYRVKTEDFMSGITHMAMLKSMIQMENIWALPTRKLAIERSL